MADSIRLELVSPEGVLASEDADAVDLPVAEGDMTAMSGHAALIATLNPGIIRTQRSDGIDEYVVTGGFVEVNATSTSILAQQAYRRSELTSEMLKTHIEKAEDELSRSAGSQRDLAETRLACLRNLTSQLGL
ncbi:MAG: ATP synthase F1 subunit epsilon [Rhodobacteraceae bacterium]|nr:ATP synthase F1 subunit epsilon [Paracoccaceae bacterium]MCY4196134.1 ATP synthase F1 subunit epsilon [Paracoccaceae bacterium]MCY4328162.1 ATP synthase F1 subunit epsilon [Paracoccaceae bacterium]